MLVTWFAGLDALSCMWVLFDGPALLNYANIKLLLVFFSNADIVHYLLAFLSGTLVSFFGVLVSFFGRWCLSLVCWCIGWYAVSFL